MSRPLVLMYHAVGTREAARDPDNLFVPEQAFAAQLDAIAAAGRTVVDLDRYLAGSAPRGAVLLTFDDAYVSTLEAAAPLLAERGWPAVVYVSTHTSGGTATWNADPTEPLLDADGLRALQSHGFTLGGHARQHVDLRGLPPDALRAEVAGCRADLVEAYGQVPRSFAYPFGLHDAAARAAVRAAGFDVGFAVHDAAGRFAVPRVDVNASDTARSFRLKLRPGFRAARQAASLAPPLRRAVHRLAGSAR